MRRVIKYEDSPLNKESYKVGGDNSKIKKILISEQNHICAYTETYLDVTDLEEIEHFNPNLKDTSQDSYQNWFLVKAKWNRRKSNKWFDEILYPTASDFEDRIIYEDGQYFAKDQSDTEAQNLIDLLMLQDELLVNQRKRYISRLREQLAFYQRSTQEFFDKRMEIDPSEIYFIRAIENEFQVKIKFIK